MVYITVMITAHNRKEFIKEAVLSALHQSLPRSEYEIIVVKNFKDSSIDDLLKESSVKSIFVDHENQGSDIVAGLDEAQGDVISFLDDDDLFLPNKLEKVKEAFKDPSVGYYKHELEIFYNNYSEDLYKLKLKKNYNLKVIDNYEKKDRFQELLNMEAQIYSSSISIRKDIFNNYSNYLIKIKHSVDVFMFYLALINPLKIILDPEVLTLYRVHDKNTWYNTSNSLDLWLEYKKSFMEKEIRDYLVMIDMVNSTPFKGSFIEDYIKKYILDLRVRLARFPSPYNNSAYRANFKEILKFVKQDKDWRSKLSNMTAFSPNFIKRKLIERCYNREMSIKQEKIKTSLLNKIE